MSKIIGNTTATPMPRSDWNQVDETKADFIKNKPDVALATHTHSDYETKTDSDAKIAEVTSYVDSEIDNVNAAVENAIEKSDAAKAYADELDTNMDARVAPLESWHSDFTAASEEDIRSLFA